MPNPYAYNNNAFLGNLYNAGGFVAQPLNQQPIPGHYKGGIIGCVKEKESLFKAAVRNGWQGLAYLILEHGYNIMLAIQDGFGENKFQLVLTLLGKNPKKEVLRGFNSRGQNLFHLFAIYGAASNLNISERIYKALSKADVDLVSKDEAGRTPLHYAAEEQFSYLVEALIAEGSHKPNERDARGNTPGALSVKGENIAKGHHILAGLVGKGEKLDVQYPEDYYFNNSFAFLSDAQKQTKKSLIGEYITTPFLHCVRYFTKKEFASSTTFSKLSTLLKFLSDHGSEADDTDSDGKDALMHVAIANSEPLAIHLLENYRFNRSSQDKEGKSLIHYVVKPLPFGSYENVTLLEAFAKKGFELTLSDGLGETPMDYALKQRDGVMAEALEKLGVEKVRSKPRVKRLKKRRSEHEGGAVKMTDIEGGKDDYRMKIKDDESDMVDIDTDIYTESESEFDSDDDSASEVESDVNNGDENQMEIEEYSRDIDGDTDMNVDGGTGSGAKKKRLSKKNETINTSTNQRNSKKFNFERDAELYIEQEEAKDKRAKEEKLPPDEAGGFDEKIFEVVFDDTLGPYDLYMTKVDLRNGLHGEFLFYRMQVLREKVRDLYVLFTKWGRIGDTGMFQKTPFATLEEAATEYNKIFKSKSGNEWQNKANFNRVKGKYRLCDFKAKVDHKDYLEPYDFKKYPESKLSKPLIRALKEITSKTLYAQAMQDSQIDTEKLPLGDLNKEDIAAAKAILLDVSKKIKIIDAEMVKGLKANHETVLRLREECVELSSRFYELIPLGNNYSKSLPPPICDSGTLQQRSVALDNLVNIAQASKMLLGSLLRCSQINPLDYCLKAMRVQIKPLPRESEELEAILKYIENTSSADMRKNVRNVFKIHRKGERKRFAKFRDMKNQIMLFHGSKAFNFMGILSQGLRIAPPEAPAAGWMFGKGIYFADMFSKSYGYTQDYTFGYHHNNNNKNSRFMLLCQVALGRTKDLTQSVYIEKLESSFDSVKALGRTGPNYNKAVVMPSGVVLPLGETVNYVYDSKKVDQSVVLAHNEYIVFDPNQVRMRYLIQINDAELDEY